MSEKKEDGEGTPMGDTPNGETKVVIEPKVVTLNNLKQVAKDIVNKLQTYTDSAVNGLGQALEADVSKQKFVTLNNLEKALELEAEVLQAYTDNSVSETEKKIPTIDKIVDIAAGLDKRFIRASLNEVYFDPKMTGHEFYDEDGDPVKVKKFDIDKDYSKVVIVSNDYHSSKTCKKNDKMYMVYKVKAQTEPVKETQIVLEGEVESNDIIGDEKELRIVVEYPEFKGKLIYNPDKRNRIKENEFDKITELNLDQIFVEFNDRLYNTNKQKQIIEKYKKKLGVKQDGN